MGRSKLDLIRKIYSITTAQNDYLEEITTQKATTVSQYLRDLITNDMNKNKEM